MGTNPKRTVTVQMVPQLTEVDGLGNKEANANWAKDPNLNLTQDHHTPTPTSTPISTEHKPDISLTASNTNNATSRILTAGHGETLVGGGGGGSNINTPLPTSSDRGKSELVIGGGEKQQMPCGGTGEGGFIRRNDNTNMNALTAAVEQEKDICMTGLMPAVASSKVDIKTNDCRDKGPRGGTGEGCAEPTAESAGGASTAKESLVKESKAGDNKDITVPKNQKPNQASDLEHAFTSKARASKHDTVAEGTGATTAKDPPPPLPLKSKKFDNNNSERLSSNPANTTTTTTTTTSESEIFTSRVSKATAPEMEYKPAELWRREQGVKETAATAPSLESRKAADTTGLIGKESVHKPSGPARPKMDLKPSDNTEPCLDKHHLPASQTGSCMSTSLRAQGSSLARGHIPAQVVDEAIQTGPGLEEEQRPHSKLYREASTMTTAETLTTNPACSKQCQDVEVQAVANVCSRAVSTSPSLLPPLAPQQQRPGAGCTAQREEAAAESLAMVCQTDGVGVRPLVPLQIQVGTCPESLTLKAGSCSSQSAGVVLHTEVTVAPQQEAKLGAKPKEPGAALGNNQKGISPLQPAYQINIEPCGQNEQAANVSRHPGQAADPQCKPGAAEEKEKTPSETPAQPTQCTKPSAARAFSSSQSESHPSASAESEAKSNVNKAAAAPPQPVASSTPQTSKHQAPSRKTEDPKPQKSSLLSGLLTGITKDFSKKDAAKSAPKKQKLEPNRKQGGEDEDEGAKPRVKSVHDVLWDEQGMTWEVYGASVDPESLGFAIQSHLQCKIKEQEKKIVAQASLKKSMAAAAAAADSPPGKGRKNKRRHQNVLRSLLQNVRRPNCCARPPPSSVLE